MPKILVQKLYDDSKELSKNHPSDSGWDCFAHSFRMIFKHGGGNGEIKVDDPSRMEQWIETDGLKLQYLERALIGTGLRVAIEEGYEFQVRPRSGLALNKGLTVLNTPGTIDCSYRGELGIIIINLSRKEQHIKIGDKIAQIVPCPVILDNIEYVSDLPDTIRGDKGFGSSGT